MATETSPHIPTAPTEPAATTLAVNAGAPRPLCWGAVLAGAVFALSVHLLMTLFLAGLGVQAADPLTDPEPGETFSIGIGIVWSLSALLALFIGGWVAGRLTPEPSRGLGKLHGALVWSVATVTTAIVVTTSAGMLVGGAAKILGRGAEVAGSGAANVASSDFVGRMVEENRDVLGGFVRELLPASEGAGGSQGGPSPQAVREVSWALVRYFGEDPETRSPEAASQLAQTIARHTGMSEAEARDRVGQLTSAYDQIQRDLQALRDRAEQKAREAAEAASDYLTHVAVWTFLAFVVGALAATLGGAAGARCRREHELERTIPVATGRQI